EQQASRNKTFDGVHEQLLGLRSVNEFEMVIRANPLVRRGVREAGGVVLTRNVDVCIVEAWLVSDRSFDAARCRACAPSTSAPLKWLRNVLLLAQPPLLTKEGITLDLKHLTKFIHRIFSVGDRKLLRLRSDPKPNALPCRCRQARIPR